MLNVFFELQVIGRTELAVFPLFCRPIDFHFVQIRDICCSALPSLFCSSELLDHRP
jgi:hypothetical protein